MPVNLQTPMSAACHCPAHLWRCCQLRAPPTCVQKAPHRARTHLPDPPPCRTYIGAGVLPTSATCPKYIQIQRCCCRAHLVCGWKMRTIDHRISRIALQLAVQLPPAYTPTVKAVRGSRRGARCTDVPFCLTSLATLGWVLSRTSPLAGQFNR